VSAATKWILAIVGLLAANVIATVVLIAASHHGSSQVIAAYDDKAEHYDDQIEQAQRNARLGWPVMATVEQGALVVTGAPAGARVQVTGYPRAHADRVFSFAGPSAPLAAHGILDVTIVVDRGGDHFVQKQVVDAP